MWEFSEFPQRCSELAHLANRMYCRDITPLYLVGEQRGGVWTSCRLMRDGGERVDAETQSVGVHVREGGHVGGGPRGE